jgi:hypothetical protein
MKQPWAWAAAAGHKRIENRSWAPPDDLLGGQFAIHAGGKVDADAVSALARDFSLRPGANELVVGAVVAIATLDEVLVMSEDSWFEQGGYGWRLRDVLRLRYPIPCPGRLSLWSLPNAVERAAVAQTDQMRMSERRANRS